MSVFPVFRWVAVASIAVVQLACAPPAAVPPQSPAVTVDLRASALAYEPSNLAVAADTSFAIRFRNDDSVAHNVAIQGQRRAFTGSSFTGPAERTHAVPALPAGTYSLVCDLHPAMRATLTVGP